jgi:hypothetical protein
MKIKNVIYLILVITSCTSSLDSNTVVAPNNNKLVDGRNQQYDSLGFLKHDFVMKNGLIQGFCYSYRSGVLKRIGEYNKGERSYYITYDTLGRMSGETVVIKGSDAIYNYIVYDSIGEIIRPYSKFLNVHFDDDTLTVVPDTDSLLVAKISVKKGIYKSDFDNNKVESLNFETDNIDKIKFKNLDNNELKIFIPSSYYYKDKVSLFLYLYFKNGQSVYLESNIVQLHNGKKLRARNMNSVIVEEGIR